MFKMSERMPEKMSARTRDKTFNRISHEILLAYALKCENIYQIDHQNM